MVLGNRLYKSYRCNSTALPRNPHSGQGRRKTGLSRPGRPALVFPKRLYPFPLPHFNDCRLCALEYPLILFWIFHPLFELQGFGIGLEIYGTALLPHVIGSNSQHLVRCQYLCSLHRPFFRNTEVEYAPHHLCSFFVYDLTLLFSESLMYTTVCGSFVVK